MPRVGVWHAELTVDATNPITGAVTIATADGAFSLNGTVQRDGVFQQTLSLRVVGGANGLADYSRTLSPKAYQGVALSLPLNYILGSVGETLAAAGAGPLDTDAGVLATPLSFWTIPASTPKQALNQLLLPLATSWRVRTDGAVWIGTDTYPPAPSVPFDVLERHFDRGWITLGCQQPFLLPGVALTISASATQGVQNVSYVIHRIDAGSVRTEAYFERTAVTS